MKTNRVIFYFLSTLLLVSCGNKVKTPVYELGDKKDVMGSGLLFSETIGFNTKDATIFEENNERFIIYDANEVSKGNQVFAIRKGVKENNKWVYKEKKIIFKGNEEGWDKYIYQPSIVKGKFTYNKEEYKYLLAYQGNNSNDNYNNHIGLAVTNDLFSNYIRVGNTPILSNPSIYVGSFGYGSPSLTSINKEGKVMLSYSFGETNLSGTRVMELDLSNLNKINSDTGYSELNASGLKLREDGIISNATFIFNDDYSKAYLINDGMPSSNAPGQSNAIEVASANSSIIYDINTKWNSIKNIMGSDTIIKEDETSLGWDEIYSGTIVTNEYGLVNKDSKKLEVIYSTYQEGIEESRYTAQLCSFEVNLSE
ncbi:MAG: hypothetical protein MR606_01410 [Mollicutes bacterium]|nr:hypothetical protein [Mollicutes bacterium]MDD7263644.1 hypothetical protein [bacterium]MDY4979257.1 hypothetical protein [Candidatus Onthovivens sp.]